MFRQRLKAALKVVVQRIRGSHLPDEEYSALVNRARAGDSQAAETLLPEAKRRSDVVGQCAALLCRPPSDENWKELCEVFDQLNQDAERIKELPWIAERLARWPDEQRYVPARWYEELYRGHGLAALKYCRNFHDHRGRRDTPVGPEQLKRLLSAPGINHLTKLALANMSLRVEGAKALASAKNTSGLQELYLYYCYLGDEGVAALAAGKHFEALQEMTLAENELTANAVKFITTAAWLPQLETLRLYGNKLGDQGAQRAGVALKKANHLRFLDLTENGITSEGLRCFSLALKQLQTTGCDQGLEKLLLGKNEIGDHGVSELARAPFDSLKELDLWANQIGPAGIKKLVAAPFFGGLQRLNVGANPIGDEGLTTLAQSEAMFNFEELTFFMCNITAEGVQELAASPLVENLKKLTLSCNPIGPQGAQAIAESPHLANLESLDLWDSKCAMSKARLEGSPYLNRLKELKV